MATPEDDLARVLRCVTMAMGCVSPLSKNRDERLAWYRLLDAVEGREPRNSLEGERGKRFDTLKEAEDYLITAGFHPIPDTCDWINQDSTVGAGIYAKDALSPDTKFRVEYEVLNKYDR